MDKSIYHGFSMYFKNNLYWLVRKEAAKLDISIAQYISMLCMSDLKKKYPIISSEQLFEV